ncbi:phosphoribosyltransferase [Noviherbaspirillum autotrophicum]|uniref:phosphoribosyltransferase n=1 Tax=Noviherbaspirillum autotrophicum TaxID=709839 RepID=UPI000B93C1BE|nr:phosphoribosyltransferase [Noviherbaspirillum autotrophicum]
MKMSYDYTTFRDRHEAGRHLAAALMHLKDEEPVVLALPRGGVPVGYEVARALDAPLDVLIVRKIGAPGHAELGLGAVVDGQHPQCILNDDIVQQIKPPPGYIEAEQQRQLAEIERRRALYCGARAPVPVEGRTVIVVDDGIATGATLKTALVALSQAGVARLIFAVPVAPADSLASLRGEPHVDEGICLLVPDWFRAVSLYYDKFDQTSDEEVVDLLNAASIRPGHEHDHDPQARPAHGPIPELGVGSELDAVPPDASRDGLPPDSARLVAGHPQAPKNAGA